MGGEAPRVATKGLVGGLADTPSNSRGENANFLTSSGRIYAGKRIFLPNRNAQKCMKNEGNRRQENSMLGGAYTT